MLTDIRAAISSVIVQEMQEAEKHKTPICPSELTAKILIAIQDSVQPPKEEYAMMRIKEMIAGIGMPYADRARLIYTGIPEVQFFRAIRNYLASR